MSLESASISPKGQISGDSEFVVLNPRDWVGKRFPLLNHIDIGDQFVSGNWTIVFYHNDCSKCQQVIPHYQQLALKQSGLSDAVSIALIEIPPHSGMIDPAGSSCFLGHLSVSDNRKWFMHTPTEITLTNAIVRSFKNTLEIESKLFN